MGEECVREWEENGVVEGGIERNGQDRHVGARMSHPERKMRERVRDRGS